MYRWIDSTGNVITTKTIREFSEKYSMSYRSSRALASGFRSRIKGWCSTNPKAKRARTRFTSRLINTKTGQSEILGQSVKGFAERHGLCMSELSKLINGRKVMYRDWCLSETLELSRFGCG
jgi:hypothetical protein